MKLSVFSGAIGAIALCLFTHITCIAGDLPGIRVTNVPPPPELLLAPGRAKTASVATPLNRDEIEYENRVRFFRQAALTAKQEKLKREASLVEAQASFERTEKLFKRGAQTEAEYRDRLFDLKSRRADVEEQERLIKQMEMDAAVSELYRRFSAGEIEDLVAIADYHVRRWENLLELNKIALKKAEAYRDWAEWAHRTTEHLSRTGAATEQQVDDRKRELSHSRSDYDLTSEKIKEAQASLDDARRTLERAKKQSAVTPPA